MPREFYSHLSALRKKACVKAVLAFALVAFLCLAPAFLFVNRYISAAMFGCFLAALAAFAVLNRRLPAAEQAPWKREIRDGKKRVLEKPLVEIMQDSYFLQTQHQNTKIRLLVQCMEEFSPDAMRCKQKAANKKANQRFGCKETVPMHQALRSVRINLAVCKRGNAELEAWVKRTNQTIHRTQSVINAAITEEPGQLLLPFLQGQFDVSEIRRYTHAAEYLLALLPEGETSEKKERML